MMQAFTARSDYVYHFYLHFFLFNSKLKEAVDKMYDTGLIVVKHCLFPASGTFFHIFATNLLQADLHSLSVQPVNSIPTISVLQYQYSNG